MSKTGFSENLVHATQAKNYPYLSGMALLPSREWVHFHDDFLVLTSSNAPTGWTAIIDSGATAVASAEHGGGITITSDGTSEGVGLYLPKSVKLTGKKFFMEVRVKTDDADDTDVQFGLSDLSATTDPEDLWDTSNADGIACGVLDGDATVKLVYDKNNGGPVTETGSIDVSDATWTTLAIWYNGGTTPADKSLKFYVNGTLAGSAATEAQIPEDVVLAPFIGARTGGDAGHSVEFDYVRFAIER